MRRKAANGAVTWKSAAHAAVGIAAFAAAYGIVGAPAASAQSSSAPEWVNPDTGRRGVDEPPRREEQAAPRASRQTGGEDRLDQRRIEANREIAWELGRLADRWDGLASNALIEELYALSTFYEDGGLGAGASSRAVTGAAAPAARNTAVILRDDFADGDFLRDPEWRPAKGGWLVDPVHGLRAVETGRGPSLSSQEVVDAAFTANTFDSRASQLIRVDAEAPNSVLLAARLTDHLGFGSAYLAVHQGAPRLSGYRVQLSNEQTPKIALWRHTRAGANLLGVAAAPEIRQGRSVGLELERTGAQRLVVRVDGREAIVARDETFKQGWTGIAFINTGGDFSLNDLSVSRSD